ncbi:MAG TPA: FkbM family methyltransferase [Gemmatimonadales bacterium]|jgi:FkbM family methyltransferase
MPRSRSTTASGPSLAATGAVPAPLRRLGRALLQGWGALGAASGWRYQVVERWGARLAEDHALRTTLPGGLAFDADLGDFIGRFTYFQGAFEPIEMCLVGRLLAPGMTVIDGGANQGVWTLHTSRLVGPTGRVIAFEPITTNFAALEHHVRLNQLGNVTLVRKALWSGAATLEFGRPDDHADNAGTWGAGVARTRDHETIEAVAFDDLGVAGSVDFIKLDVEGSELAALHGMRRTIDQDSPLMLVELSRGAARRAGASVEDLWRHITAELGYQVWRIGSTPALSGLITDPATVEDANTICYRGPMPEALKAGWDYKQVLKWARSG